MRKKTKRKLKNTLFKLWEWKVEVVAEVPLAVPLDAGLKKVDLKNAGLKKVDLKNAGLKIVVPKLKGVLPSNKLLRPWKIKPKQQSLS